MLALGLIGVVLLTLGLLSFVSSVSGYSDNETRPIGFEVATTLVGAVCLYLSIVL